MGARPILWAYGLCEPGSGYHKEVTMQDSNRPVGEAYGLIDSLLGNHAQDLQPGERDQLKGMRDQLQQNEGYYQQ